MTSEVKLEKLPVMSAIFLEVCWTTSEVNLVILPVISVV